MALFANGQIFGVPNGIDTIAESTVGPYTAATNTYIDPDTAAGMVLTPGANPGLTTANSTYYFRNLDSVLNSSGVVLDSTHCVYNVVGAGAVPEWTGEWRFDGDNLVRRSGGDRFQIGSSEFTGTDGFVYTLILGEDGFTMTSYGDGPLILHTAGANPATSNLQGLVFEGNTTGQLSPRIGQFGFVPSNVAVGVETPTGFGYSVRIVHQPARGGVPLNSNGTPGGFCLYTNTDLRNILIGGRTAGAAFEDSGGGTNKRATWQMNHSTALWFVNPLWTPEADNDPLLLSTHSGQFPTPATSCEVRTFTLHKPSYFDADTAAVIADAKVKYTGEARSFPESYVDNVVPAAIINDEGSTSGVGYNGYIVQDTRVRLTANVDNPADVTIPRPSGHTFKARSFTHDVSYDNVLTPTIATGLTTVDAEVFEAVALTPYLGGYATSALAPLAVLSNLGDTYAVARKIWYDEATLLTTEFPIDGIGDTLVFNSSFQFGGATTVGTDGIRIPGGTADTTITGDIRTWIFGPHSIGWDNRAWATGMTISGGFHNNIGTTSPAASVLAGVTWTAVSVPTIRIPTGFAEGSFEDLFGDVTGDFNVGLLPAQTVEITATASQQDQILNRAQFVNQLEGQAAILFTRFIDITQFDASDNKQVHLFNGNAGFMGTIAHEGGVIRLLDQAGATTSQGIITVDGRFRVTERNLETGGQLPYDNRVLAVSSSDISIPQIRYLDTTASATLDIQFVTDPSVATTANIAGLSIFRPATDTTPRYDGVFPRMGSFDNGVVVVTRGFGDSTAAQSRVFASDVRNTRQYAQWISAQFNYADEAHDGTDLSNLTSVQATTADFSASGFFEVPSVWQFQPDEAGAVSLQSYSILNKQGEPEDLLLDATITVQELTSVEINATINSTVEIDYSRVNLEAENAARTAIDGTIMNMVDETHNASNYLLTNGVDADGGGGYDRLIGIKPRAANYNPTRNY